MPVLAQIAIGKLPVLHIFGGDYPTEDGTGVRDYIHVMDLARGHVSAIDKLKSQHVRLRVSSLNSPLPLPLSPNSFPIHVIFKIILINR